MWLTNCFVAFVFLSVTFLAYPICFDSLQRMSFSAGDSIGTYNDVSYDPSTSSEMLLVSSFFPASTTVHFMREYRRQLAGFLGHITTDVYIFTSPALEPLVRKLRGELPITINTTFSSPFDISPLKNFQLQYHVMPSLKADGRHQHLHHHYALSNSRPYFVAEAATNMLDRGIAYDFVFWNDLETLRSRTHRYTSWPDRRRVNEIWEEGRALVTTSSGYQVGNIDISKAERNERDRTRKSTEIMLFFPIHRAFKLSMKYWQDSLGPVNDDVSQGAFFGGSPQSLQWWRNAFYAYHDHYLAQGAFAGEASSIENALFLLFPERIISVWVNDPLAPAALYPPTKLSDSVSGLDGAQNGLLGNCGSQERLYYQFFFSNTPSMQRLRQMWNLEASPWLPWNWGKQGNVIRMSCRITRVVWMKEVLLRSFGGDWVIPVPSIELNESGSRGTGGGVIDAIDGIAAGML